jgi:hypothetical protein
VALLTAAAVGYGTSGSTAVDDWRQSLTNRILDKKSDQDVSSTGLRTLQTTDGAFQITVDSSHWLPRPMTDRASNATSAARWMIDGRSDHVVDLEVLTPPSGETTAQYAAAFPEASEDRLQGTGLVVRSEQGGDGSFLEAYEFQSPDADIDGWLEVSDRGVAALITAVPSGDGEAARQLVDQTARTLRPA